MRAAGMMADDLPLEYVRRVPVPPDQSVLSVDYGQVWSCGCSPCFQFPVCRALGECRSGVYEYSHIHARLMQRIYTNAWTTWRS